MPGGVAGSAANLVTLAMAATLAAADEPEEEMPSTQAPGAGGEIGDAELADEKYRLGRASLTDPTLTESFPFEARALIEGSQDLYDRVARLEERLDRMSGGRGESDAGPARALLDRLNTAF